MDENQNNVLSSGKLLTCWPAKPQCPHTARATSFLLSGSDDVFNLIQSILGPLANAEAWKQHALLKLLEGCLIEDRVMTDSVAINRVRCLYLAFIEESAIPDGLDNWIRHLRSRNVSIDRLRSGLDLKKRQVINDNATIDGVHSGLTGSTVDHGNGELAADGIQALEAPDVPVAADGIQAPNQQDAGRLQVQRSAAISNLRGLGHREEGDESTPSEGDYGSSTVGYHVSRGSDGTNPNGDA
jgi:hypothetical protein